MNGTVQLTVRQQEVLRRVVEEYVATGQPVGSKTLVERAGLSRVESLGLAERSADALTLTERGRFLGGAVTAELLA